MDAAVAAFQREIQNSPRNIPARLQIAAARYRLDSADVIKYAKEAVEFAPQEPFGHYLLGLLYVDTGDYSRAISELEISKRAYSKVPDVYFALGTAYARVGRKQEAAQARVIFRRLSDRPAEDSSNNTYRGRSSNLDPERLGHETGSHPLQ